MVAAFVVCVSIGEVAVRVGVPGVRSEGPNAMWMRHTWIGEPHSQAQLRELASSLTAMRITDAYFHAGPLRSDGTVDPKRIRYAAILLSNMKRFAPRVRLHAWLGQVEAKAGGRLDLTSVETRKAVVGTANRFLNMGFDGIQYDIEPIRSGDRVFLDLLKNTRRETARRHRILSVAACKPEPFRGAEWTARRVSRFPGYWTRDYFLKVADQCDQVAIMTYDSAIPLPSVYVRLVSWVSRWSAEHTRAQVLIGTPTYSNWAGAHYPYVENVSNGLLGVKHGLAGLPKSARHRVGVAIFAQWTTSLEETKTYGRLWTGNQANTQTREEDEDVR